MITIISAVAKNNVIGKNNALPWHISEDLKHFKNITDGKTVLMGQRTFESVGSKPFSNRKNIVISNSPGFTVPDGVILRNDLQAALKEFGQGELFIIGGASIYKQTIDIADQLIITHIDKAVEGDVFFPQIDPAKWEVTSEKKHEGFSFVTYRKIEE